MKTTDAPLAGYVDLLAAVVRRAERDARGECLTTVTPGQYPMVRHEAAAWLRWARAELAPLADVHEQHNRIRRIG